MASIAEVRAKYPQYKDLSDQQLADGMHKKFYSDMPKDEFYAKIGLSVEPEGSGVLMNTTAGINEGIYGTLGAPVDLARGAINLGARGINAVAGTEIPMIPSDSFGGSESISNMFGAVGVPEPEEVVAGSTGEKLARGVGQGVGYTVAPGGVVAGAERVGAMSPRVADMAKKLVGGTGSVGEVASNAFVGGVSGAGAAAAEEAAPERYKPLASLAGGLVGGGVGAVTAAVPSMLKSAGRVAADVAAPLYPAGRERMAAQQIADEATDIGAVKQALAEPDAELVPGSKPTTFQLTGDLGLGGLERSAQVKAPDQFAQRRGDQNAARLAAINSVQAEGAPETVANAARQFVKGVNERAQAAYDDVASRATQGADETVSKAAADAEAVAAQAKADLDNAVALAQANADTMTEAAMMDAEAQIATLRQQADDAAGRARELQDALGTGVSPTGSGEAMRSSLEEARAAAKATERQLWGAVDPDGTLALPAQNTRQQARQVISELPQSAKPPSGEEAAILEAVGNYQDVMPFSELTALQSRIKAELRAERLANGESPAYRRLSQLSAATEADIEAAIAGKMDTEAAAVARGEMSQNDTLAEFLKRQVNDWVGSRQARARSPDGEVGASTTARLGTSSIPGDGGAAGQANGRSFQPQGDTRVSGTSLEPNFDPAALDRLKAARSSTRERVETFDNKTLGPVRKRPSTTSPYDMAAETVPNKVFFNRPESVEAIAKYRRAVGQEVADQQIEQYAIDRLRKSAMRPDGTLDPAKLAMFRRGHSDALRAMPGLDAKLANVETASRAMADAADTLTVGSKAAQAQADTVAKQASSSASLATKEAEREAAQRIKAAQAVSSTISKEARARADDEISAAAKAQKAEVDEVQRSRLGQLMNLDDPQDVTRSIGSIFNRQDAMKEMRKVRNAVDADPEAKSGLRKAIVDHITSKFVGNTEAATSGAASVRSDQFQTFVKNHARTLEAAGFTKDEVANMQAVAADLQRANRSMSAVKNPGGSNTAQDTFAAQKGDRATTVLARVLLAAGATGGFLTGGGLGAATGVLGAKVVSGMREAGIKSVDDIVADAMLNPERARILLSKMPMKPDEGALDTLARMYRKSGAGTVGATLEGESQQPSAGKTTSKIRPFAPGEYIDNADGSISTERTVTIQDKNGNWVNVPSLWKDANGKTIDLGDDDEKIGRTLNLFETGGGKAFPRFKTVDEAEKAARERSESGGAFSDDKSLTLPIGKTARGLDADGSRNRPVSVESYKDLKAGADRVNAAPTDGQKKAGNYAKLHARVSGFDIAIENPAGSVRKGKNRSGKEWHVKMPVPYGYLKGTSGADGDPIDVFVGKNIDSDRIYVIDQITPGGKFDEHKVIMGASNPEEAKEMYIKSFSDGRGEKRIGAMQPMSKDKFRKWLDKGDHSGPVRFDGGIVSPKRKPLEITVRPRQSN